MVNEWVKVELYGNNGDGQPRRYTIADGTAVSKGTLLALTDPRTVTASDGTTVVFAGVAAESHSPGLGVTSITAFTQGIFEATASLAIGIGTPITGTTTKANDLNFVGAAGVLLSGASVIGYTLETATNAETINVRLNL